MSDYIIEDHVFQIMKYLPVKSLLRFRCVSKWWKETIDSDFFMREHLFLQKPQLLVAYENPYELLVLDPQTLPSIRTFRTPYQYKDTAPVFGLLGTLHGVVCLFDNQYNQFMLWNPTTRNISLRIPPPECIESEWNDWMDSAPYFGFWVDPSNKSFKIIVFTLDVTDEEDFVMDAVMYSSITKEWTFVPLDEFMSECTSLNEGPPVIIDGVAYWGALEEWLDDSGSGSHSEMVLLSFDFTLEVFDTINAPRESHCDWSLPIHCNLQGALSSVYWEEKDPHRCDIYLWQNDTWVKTFDFMFVPGINSIFWVLGGTKESCRAIASIEGALVMYDTKDGCIKLKRLLDEPSMMLMAYDFVESLFSLEIFLFKR